MSGKGVMGVLIVCLIAAGCSDKDGIPRGILPKDKMEEVMWDMAQADQYAALYLAKDSAHIDQKTETMRLYEEVFRLHHVTREEFGKSYRYYLDHPALSQQLFDSVIARGSRVRSELYDRPGKNLPAMGPVKLGPVTPVKPGAITPGRPGSITTGKPGTVTTQVPVRPTVPMATPVDPARRTQEAMRRRDSMICAMQMRRDTTKGRP